MVVPSQEGLTCLANPDIKLTIKAAGYQDYVYLLPARGCGYYATGIITLTPNPAKTPLPRPTPYPLCDDCTRYVSGLVANSNTGERLAGAKVYERDYSNNDILMATTNADGKFFYTRYDQQNVMPESPCPVYTTLLTVKATGYLDYTTYIPVHDCSSGGYLTINPVQIVP